MNKFTLMIKDSAMIISNSEYVLDKHCLMHDDFEAHFEVGLAPCDKDKSYRLNRVYYNDSNDNVIYITSVYFEYTENSGDIKVEYIKED